MAARPGINTGAHPATCVIVWREAHSLELLKSQRSAFFIAALDPGMIATMCPRSPVSPMASYVSLLASQYEIVADTSNNSCTYI
jgi:hypothetical protein